MQGCLFCGIAERKIPSAVVFENDRVLGFKDVKPQAPLHVLFIPKKHIANVYELDRADGLLDELVSAANHTALKENVQERGFRLVINCKADGGQTVDHLHLHLLGGRKMTWPPG